jgi:hypothetical protein
MARDAASVSLPFKLAERIALVDQQRERTVVAQEFADQFETLGCEHACDAGYSCHIAARSIEAHDQTFRDRIGPQSEDHRDGRSDLSRRRFGDTRGGRAERHNEVHPQVNKLGGQNRQSLVDSPGPAKLDRHVLTFDNPFLSQTLACSLRLHHPPELGNLILDQLTARVHLNPLDGAGEPEGRLVLLLGAGETNFAPPSLARSPFCIGCPLAHRRMQGRNVDEYCEAMRR